MQAKLNLIAFIKIILRYEWRLHLRAGQSCWMPAAFLLLMLCIWPMALPAEGAMLAKIGPGMIWIGVLLSVILILDKLFLADFSDQAIIHWLMSRYPLMTFVYIRCLSVSVLFIISMVVLVPVIVLLYQFSWQTGLHLLATLILGIPSLIAIGAVISALLVGVGQRSLLLPLLIIPLWCPVLIFSTTSIYQQMLGMPTMGHFALLSAILLLTYSTAPFAVAASLRMGLE